MKNSYNTVAPFYDFLATCIYGGAVIQSQIFLINTISANSSVLIVGGGTGGILEEISKKHPKGLNITYIDISVKMIALSKKRNIGNNNVVFICSAMQACILYQPFDIVITPFFFDNFHSSTAEVIFNKIDTLLKPGGLWLFADFQLGKKSVLWQKLLLHLMYVFFRFFCNIEASQLPKMPSFFKKYNYTICSAKMFYQNFIGAIVYKKQLLV